MVIHLKSLPDDLVVNIITQMDPFSFRNASLSSKFIIQITTKYRRFIRIWLPGFEMDLRETWMEKGKRMVDSNVLAIFISKVNDFHQWKCKCRPGEILKTRPELCFFIFENILPRHSLNAIIVEELRKENVFCYRVHMSDNLYNQTIRALRPSELVVNCDEDQVPSEMIEEVLLKTITVFDISVHQEDQVKNCLEKLVHRIPKIYLHANGVNLAQIESLLDLIKGYIEKIMKGCGSITNKDFYLDGDIPSSEELVHLIRPFQEMPHTLWKISENNDNVVVFFFPVSNGSTLSLYIAESVMSGQKKIKICYEVLTDSDQFLQFYARSRGVPLQDCKDEITNGRQRKRRFNQMKKEYFSNKLSK